MMTQTNKIPLTTVMERLSEAVGWEVRPKHIAVLIHGWRKKKPHEAPSVATLYERKKKDGFAWLTRQETADLSRYAGYEI